MKRSTAVVALGLLLALPCLALVAHGERPDKGGKPELVTIAHLAEVIEGYVDVDGDFGEAGAEGTLSAYVVITISEKALDMHLAHGDLAVWDEPGRRFARFAPNPPGL